MQARPGSSFVRRSLIKFFICKVFLLLGFIGTGQPQLKLNQRANPRCRHKLAGRGLPLILRSTEK
jgi:hypothetical protein